MLGGNNKNIIFYEDYIKFQETILRFKEEFEIYIYAYALMDNHIHLLVEEANEKLPTFFRKVCASFVY
ncbi:transposase [Criibacterium bergeronii]|uniref:Transposase IS200-like domain-containing protein n=1 Tax=Criibacterium bergeronii TaxID=1871336 RepID=A0A371IKY7_9FIRM|nr:transposase [Peptostreptococcaceae bacterium]RDY21133.1 hypothetical protein BBG48_006290 [Criibacterium bergeronii]